jgi:septum formation protein
VEAHTKKNIFKRLGLPFITKAPSVDEAPSLLESARALTIRLAGAKAQKISTLYRNACVISTDQSADCAGEILGKPKSKDRAVDMLHRLSGKDISFFTTVGFCAPDKPLLLHTEEVIVSIRELSHTEIVRYIDADEPLDCAGSFKVEHLGISLFRSVKSEDPTALEGLPLIQLCQWLRDQGFSIP